MLVLVDNYDSFTYNLVQAFGELGAQVAVYRNDQVTAYELAELNPRGIVISPGPGAPQQAGISKALVERFADKVPILGVGLGHLCIAEAFGGRVKRAELLMHGKACQVLHDGSQLYQGIPSPFKATCYHSLLVAPGSLSNDLEVTARTAEGQIMGVRHKTYDVDGVQFHPESIFTEWGRVLLANYLRKTGLEPTSVAAPSAGSRLSTSAP